MWVVICVPHFLSAILDGITEFLGDFEVELVELT